MCTAGELYDRVTEAGDVDLYEVALLAMLTNLLVAVKSEDKETFIENVTQFHFLAWDLYDRVNAQSRERGEPDAR